MLNRQKINDYDNSRTIEPDTELICLTNARQGCKEARETSEIQDLETILIYLKDENSSIRWIALNFLKEQPSTALDAEILEAVFMCLVDENADIRGAALNILIAGQQEKKTPTYIEVITELIRLLENPYAYREAARALVYFHEITLGILIIAEQHNLPYTIFNEPTGIPLKTQCKLIRNLLKEYQNLSVSETKNQAKRLIRFLHAINIHLIIIGNKCFIERDPLIGPAKENKAFILKDSYKLSLQKEIEHLNKNLSEPSSEEGEKNSDRRLVM